MEASVSARLASKVRSEIIVIRMMGAPALFI
jgi:hypothetical protein